MEKFTIKLFFFLLKQKVCLYNIFVGAFLVLKFFNKLLLKKMSQNAENEDREILTF